MKINWGTSVVIAFVLFISFILFFIIKVQSDSKYDNELVVEEYYKHDALYSSEFKKIQNAQDLKDKPEIKVSAAGVSIVFPAAFEQEKVIGTVFLYRPSAKHLDFNKPLKLSNSSLLIPTSDFVAGNWDMTISWSYDGISYLSKQKLYIQ